MTIKQLAILVSSEDLEARTRSVQSVRSILGVKGSDVLARLSRVASDYAAEYPGLAGGRDPFEDDTGTGYGGMKWMAPIEGSWKAKDGILDLVSSKHRSLAESTLVTDTLNGSAQVGFKLTSASEKEYGGIAFRLLDKDNYFFVMYDIESDTIQLCRNVTSGTDVILAQSAAMGWSSSPTAWRYLRVELHYALVFVYTSTDGGITWNSLTWATGSNELPGMNFLDSSVKYTDWSGKFAVVGKGKSDVDAPPPWEPPVYEPPNPATPPGTGDARELWWATQHEVIWSGDYFSTWGESQPNWNTNSHLPEGTPDWFGITRYGVAYMHTNAAGLFRCTLPKASVPVWDCILKPTDAIGSRTVVGTNQLTLIYKEKVATFALVEDSSHNHFWQYGEYNGTSWAWQQPFELNTFWIGGLGPGFYTGWGSWTHGRIYDKYGTLLDGNLSWAIGYRMLLTKSGVRIAARLPNAADHTFVYNINNQSNEFDLGFHGDGAAFGEITLNGALEGEQVYIVMTNGDLYSRSASYAKLATWRNGYIADTSLTGGGPLVWIPRYIDQSNVPTRLYAQDGSVTADMTGDLWSKVTGPLVDIGMGLVF